MTYAVLKYKAMPMALSTLILANINWRSPAKKTFGRFPHRLIYSTHTLVINLVPRSYRVTVTEMYNRLVVEGLGTRVPCHVIMSIINNGHFLSVTSTS